VLKKEIFILIVAVSASLTGAQDKPFFSAQYPAAGVSLPTAPARAGEDSASRVRNSRVVSSDDLRNGQTQAGQTNYTVRPPNLTQYGADFDKRHPELWESQPDLDAVKRQLDQAQASPTPSPIPTPTSTPTPTPVRIKIGRRIYSVNPNATLQPAANQSATPVIILVQPKY
jgi:hypothetical protein